MCLSCRNIFEVSESQFSPPPKKKIEIKIVIEGCFLNRLKAILINLTKDSFNLVFARIISFNSFLWLFITMPLVIYSLHPYSPYIFY